VIAGTKQIAVAATPKLPRKFRRRAVCSFRGQSRNNKDPHGAKAARSAVPEVHLGRCRVAVLDAELAFYVWLGVVRACWAQLSTLAYTEYVPGHDCFGRCRQPT
jgi:hypothetical protein